MLVSIIVFLISRCALGRYNERVKGSNLLPSHRMPDDMGKAGSQNLSIQMSIRKEEMKETLAGSLVVLQERPPISIVTDVPRSPTNESTKTTGTPNTGNESAKQKKRPSKAPVSFKMLRETALRKESVASTLSIEGSSRSATTEEPFNLPEVQPRPDSPTVPEFIRGPSLRFGLPSRHKLMKRRSERSSFKRSSYKMLHPDGKDSSGPSRSNSASSRATRKSSFGEFLEMERQRKQSLADTDAGHSSSRKSSLSAGMQTDKQPKNPLTDTSAPNTPSPQSPSIKVSIHQAEEQKDSAVTGASS